MYSEALRIQLDSILNVFIWQLPVDLEFRGVVSDFCQRVQLIQENGTDMRKPNL